MSQPGSVGRKTPGRDLCLPSYSSEYPKEWIFSKNLKEREFVPRRLTRGSVPKLNIRKRYGKVLARTRLGM